MNKEVIALSEKVKNWSCEWLGENCFIVEQEDIKQALKDEWKDIVDLCWSYFYEEPAFKPFMDQLKMIKKKHYGSLADEEPKTEVKHE